MDIFTNNVNREKVQKTAEKAKITEQRIIADLGISPATYYRRMNNGWTVEQSIALCFVLGIKDVRKICG